MDKKDVISFFDGCAGKWDKDNFQNEDVIKTILHIAGVEKEKSILDVACGTGVLFPYYLENEVESVTAIDISPEMVSLAKEKYPRINVICGDAEAFQFKKKFDCILIYNAFPHFVDDGALFENLSAHLNNGGRLTVAHGASREDILKCHSGKAKSISKELPEAEKLAEKMMKFIDVDVIISSDEMYVVSGCKKY